MRGAASLQWLGSAAVSVGVQRLEGGGRGDVGPNKEMVLRAMKEMKSQLDELQLNVSWLIRCVEEEKGVGVGLGLGDGLSEGDRGPCVLPTNLGVGVGVGSYTNTSVTNGHQQTSRGVGLKPVWRIRPKDDHGPSSGGRLVSSPIKALLTVRQAKESLSKMPIVKATAGEVLTEALAMVPDSSSEPNNADEGLGAGSSAHLSQTMPTSDKDEAAIPPTTASSPAKVTQQMEDTNVKRDIFLEEKRDVAADVGSSKSLIPIQGPSEWGSMGIFLWQVS